MMPKVLWTDVSTCTIESEVRENEVHVAPRVKMVVVPDLIAHHRRLAHLATSIGVASKTHEIPRGATSCLKEETEHCARARACSCSCVEREAGGKEAPTRVHGHVREKSA